MTGGGHEFIVHLASGDVTAKLTLTDAGKIAGLLLRPAATQGSLDDHVRAIAALPGETSILVTREGTTLAAVRAEDPLAVASAFKLAVLKAVTQAVEQRHLAWDQVVRLDPAWRSLPSGTLQGWPAGTPVTVATLADMMISVSDNTAADALVALAGRDRVEAVSPRNAPFLTTRETFVLKADTALSRSFLAADTDGRRRLLSHIATQPLPAPGALPNEPDLAIEWRFTARELAVLLGELAGTPALHINPGPADPGKWQSVAFKGGSEPGCVNLSTLAVDRRGTRFAVIATWNGPSANVDELSVAYDAILHSLAQGTG